MKKRITKIVIISLIAVMLVSLLVVGVNLLDKNAGDSIRSGEGFMATAWEWFFPEKEEPVDIKMFSAYTDVEQFKNVPAMNTKGQIVPAEDYGNENYLITINGSTEEEYKAYLETLTKAGFKKHSDNGEDAMEGYALAAAFQKDNLTLTVSHGIKINRTFISASYDLPLSEHLIYKDEYMEGADPNAKTKIHMLQLEGSQGSSFIYQLKNGHFVIHDGGLQAEAEYLLNYLEELTPGDEIPVVEAWFISHCHNDHYGAMLKITQRQGWLRRIRVNGFYYVEPSATLFANLTTQTDPSGNSVITSAYVLFQNEDGGVPEFYRPQFGQRYYFADITIDVTMTLEQLPLEGFRGTDFNDTSVWLMHHIDGQRILYAGDSGMTGTYAAIEMFDKEYFDMDIFIPFHHGINVYDHFTDYCTYDTVLYPAWRAMSIWESREDLKAEQENENLKAKAKEVYHYGEGTVILTFPYNVGEAEVLEGFEASYTPT